MAYQLEGQMLEVCSCNVICPCWVGEDPDGGTCDGLMAWHIEDGAIDGVDVSGRTIALMVHIPGNALKGNWRAVAYIDDQASDQQHDALLNVWTGKLGGPVADLAQLVGEVVAVQRAPIRFDVSEAEGSVTVGDKVTGELEPFKGPTGRTTALHDTMLSPTPGTPTYVGKASRYEADVPELGLNISLTGHSAVQGSFRFEA